jgi:hypothetical protein
VLRGILTITTVLAAPVVGGALLIVLFGGWDAVTTLWEFVKRSW